MFTTTPIGRALPMMVADRARDPRARRRARRARAKRSGRATATCSAAPSTAATSRADVDPELVIDTYVSPVFYRFLISDPPLDAEFADTLVDTVLRAFA